MDRDTDGKRRRNALSCAECRRLKLKCDRSFPCSSCKKRGCAAICPDGALTTGKLGGRFILANTEELHEKIALLQGRIGELEEALTYAHASTSSSPHPLLREDLLAIKTPLGAELVGRSNDIKLKASSSRDDEVVESFGTLKIGEGGVSTFYGTTVGSEFLFEDEGDEGADPTGPETTGQAVDWISPVVSHLAHALPFANLTSDVEVVKSQLYRYLPSTETAEKLAHAYFDNAAWMYNPLHKESFWNDILIPLYNSTLADRVTSHALSVAFSVLALGVLVDLDRAPYDPEADRFYQLSRAALAAESCLENTTIDAVQSLILMSYYNQMTDNKAGPALTWTLNGLAMKLAQSIGLHRDWEKWGLPMQEVAIRRTVMWECIVFDSWSAFGFGRPPSQAMHFVDCKQTPDPQNPDDPCASFGSLKYAFTELLLDVINVSFGATPPSYDDILKLDRRLRDYYIPPLFQVAGINEDEKPRPTLPRHPPLALALQSHALPMLRENALLYMHRSFFAKVLNEQPEDLLQNRYTPSVLACHRSACSIIVIVRKLHYIEPRLVLRFWYFWVHSFTSAVVLAAIVTKAPGSTLAKSSLAHVDLACELFQEVAAGSRPASSLPILLRIRQKAHEVMTAFAMGAPSPDGDGKSESPPHEGGTALDPMLSGKTRLVAKSRRKMKVEQGTSSIAQTVDQEEQFFNHRQMENVHPALVDHLRTLGVSRPTYQYPVQPSGPAGSDTSIQRTSSHSSSASHSSPPSHITHDQRSNSQQRLQEAWSGEPRHQTVHAYHHATATYNYTPQVQNQEAPLQYNATSHYAPQYWEASVSPVSSTVDYPRRSSVSESYQPQGHYQAATRAPHPPAQQQPTFNYNLTQPPTSHPAVSHTHTYHEHEVAHVSHHTQQPYSFQNNNNSQVTWHSPATSMHQTAAASISHGYAQQSPAVGGLMHSGGAGTLEQNWRNFLTRVDFPTSPIPPPQQHP
ncbi:hypothetical protein FRB95_002135 [Tulasnella sp. JGI-2019a]|nr:hypothetical protein FRB95_002135 [Tulasnella sp. JGI-2019a]